MKKTVKKPFPVPFEVGKTYTTRMAVGWKFSVNVIKTDKNGVVTGFQGIWETNPELGNCPLGADRLIPDMIEREVEITVCDDCGEECGSDKCKKKRNGMD